MPTAKPATAQPKAGAVAPTTWRGRLTGMVIVTMFRLPRLLPWRARLALADFLMAYLFAPLAGYRRRIRANLAHVLPDLPEPEIRRLCRRVPGNTARFITEVTSVKDFRARVSPVPMTGPGVDTLRAALDAKRPVIMVSGHFGNFDAVRVALTHRGYSIGALYRPHDDPYVDAHYTAMLSGIAEPIFPKGRRGLGAMLKFLRKGNALAILVDQHVKDGAPLTFFGKPAATTLSAAEMALKYNALLVPAYGIRRKDGFDVIIEEPIAEASPEEMMQAVNDSLEARIRADMDQWLWIHRRWKLSGG
ncbi:MAG: lysophospholipid acyltransferase family protein [Mangrovicoccus sp.]|nr:lysophospholipid acyltransferase family protein [Mangrovicoccus sp.]